MTEQGYRRAMGHAHPHSTTETWNTRCDMCPSLSCIEQPGSRLSPWRYYCDAAGRTVDPRTVGVDECPTRRRKPRGRA